MSAWREKPGQEVKVSGGGVESRQRLTYTEAQGEGETLEGERNIWNQTKVKTFDGSFFLWVTRRILIKFVSELSFLWDFEQQQTPFQTKWLIGGESRCLTLLLQYFWLKIRKALKTQCFLSFNMSTWTYRFFSLWSLSCEMNHPLKTSLPDNYYFYILLLHCMSEGYLIPSPDPVSFFSLSLCSAYFIWWQ